MRRPQPKSFNTRNGLKWRDGRPRWEPSPANRAAGMKGVDLRDLDGRWIPERGTAIAICDLRTAWATLIREAKVDGPVGEDARQEIREALGGLAQPSHDGQRLKRLLTQDLIDLAAALLAGADAAAGLSLRRAPRTVERLVEAYFDAVDRGEVKVDGRPLRKATRQAYWAQRARILAKFEGRGVGSLTRNELKEWYDNELCESCSLSTAKLTMNALSAMLSWAELKDWIGVSPATRLKLRAPDGRLVFWTMAEEDAFTAWCDANAFEDVADAVVMGLWTGARPIDMCAADVQDLGGANWRFTPIKTERKGNEAMPSIMAPLKARIERRRASAAADAVRHLNATPFLWDFRTGRRHDVRSLWTRYVDARGLALAAKAVPETLAEKRLQDTRDTCITRLWEAGIEPARMWPWTGHSQKSIERILRQHYIVLREQGMGELAERLEAWAVKERLALS